MKVIEAKSHVYQTYTTKPDTNGNSRKMFVITGISEAGEVCSVESRRNEMGNEDSRIRKWAVHLGELRVAPKLWNALCKSPYETLGYP